MIHELWTNRLINNLFLVASNKQHSRLIEIRAKQIIRKFLLEFSIIQNDNNSFEKQVIIYYYIIIII